MNAVTPGAHIHRVGHWLADLHTLAANKLEPGELTEKIAALASLLAEDFPLDAVFCRESLRHVAAECRFFASYAEVHRSLGAWWKEHRPQLPALPPPAPDHPRVEPTEEAHAYVADVVRKLSAELGYPPDAAPDKPIPVAGQARPGHLSDGQLLELYAKLAAAGNAPAATRLEMLRKKLAKPAQNIPQNIPDPA